MQTRSRLVGVTLATTAGAFAGTLLVGAAPLSAATPDGLNTRYLAGAIVASPSGAITVAATTQHCDLSGVNCEGSAVRTFADLAVVRFTSNGQLDPGFAGDGYLSLPSTSADGDVERVIGMARQADGTVVVAASTNPDAGSSLELVRVSDDGMPDPAFGGDGRVRLLNADAPGFRAAPGPNAMVLAPSGETYVVGQVGFAYPAPSNLAVAAFKPDGALDAGFGDHGIASVSVPKATSVTPGALALMPDGALVVAAGRLDGSPGSWHGDLVATRLDSNGSVDPSFGAGGWQAFGGVEAIGSTLLSAPAVLEVAGGVTIAGSQVVGPPEHSSACFDTVLAQLSSTGAFDLGFGQGGTTIGAPSGYRCGVRDAARDSSGRLSVLLDAAQSFGMGHGTDLNSLAFQRYEANGERDLAYGTDGFASYEVAGFLTQPTAVTDTDDGPRALGNVINTQHCKGADPAGGYCTALVVAGLEENGDLDSEFGKAGLATFPPIHICRFAPTERCGIDLSDGTVASRISRGIPGSVRLAGDAIRFHFRCVELIDATCRLHFRVLKDSQALASGTVKAGRGETAKVRIALDDRALHALRRASTVFVGATARISGRGALVGGHDVRLR